MAAMTTTDYLINAVFVLIVFRQARERELDRRSVIIPLAILAYVAHLYVRSIPTAGNDIVLIGGLLSSLFLTLILVPAMYVTANHPAAWFAEVHALGDSPVAKLEELRRMADVRRSTGDWRGVLVDDSPAALAEGRALGMTTVGVVHSLNSRADVADADFVIDRA